ncbi:RyR domain-containing protein [Rhizorhabdus sp.]|uniref:RyR domain-containing protein n=1 Tax=Rhizorhabdus sp. TaxID=1968843 RepID=UPI0035B0ED53
MSKGFHASVVLAIAMITHSANAAWCEHLGDASQLPWADAPDWQRDSAIHGVEFHLANPDASDSASHDEWMKVKLADGWTHGDVKDAEKKTHPCLVDFDKLPAEQQFKDKLFRTLVHASFEAMKPTLAALDASVADQAELQAEIAKLNSAASRAPAPARTRGKPRAEKRRACGPMDRVDKATLGELIQSAAHEVVFSDGQSEIAGLEPVMAKPDAWLRHANGWLFGESVLVDGPQRGAAPFVVAGFGLFDEEGEQVAYSPLHEPVTVAPGSITEFRRTIIF